MSPSAIDPVKQPAQSKNPHIKVTDSQPYQIREQSFGTKKRMRIVVIGAGVSGLSFFKMAEENLKNVEIICYEKNTDIGGTVSNIEFEERSCLLIERYSGWRIGTRAVLVTFLLLSTNIAGNHKSGQSTTRNLQRSGAISRVLNKRTTSLPNTSSLNTLSHMRNGEMRPPDGN